MDEECHIEGETEFEVAVAECCDARNRYCNRSGFSALQRVFGSSLRLPGSLLSDDPFDRQLLTADPYTNFYRGHFGSSFLGRSRFSLCTCCSFLTWFGSEGSFSRSTVLSLSL